MSRGDRAPVISNLLHSMRGNYEEHGVEEYYKKVASTYRNPHYPGVRSCLFAWFNKWREMEHIEGSERNRDQLFLFDMACGSGEATVAFAEWWRAGCHVYSKDIIDDTSTVKSVKPDAIGPNLPLPRVAAADPFTGDAFRNRTSLPCSSLSFEDIAEGSLPDQFTDISNQPFVTSKFIIEAQKDDISKPPIEMVVCSFALHLIQNPSSLFALLYELSIKTRWLVILTPHKRPEIKDGWGWVKWNPGLWQACPMTDNQAELLRDRVHCRIYRSLNF